MKHIPFRLPLPLQHLALAAACGLGAMAVMPAAVSVSMIPAESAVA